MLMQPRKKNFRKKQKKSRSFGRCICKTVSDSRSYRMSDRYRPYLHGGGRSGEESERNGSYHQGRDKRIRWCQERTDTGRNRCLRLYHHCSRQGCRNGRFDGKPLISTKVSDGINKAQELIERALSGNAPVITARAEQQKRVVRHLTEIRLDVRFIRA